MHGATHPPSRTGSLVGLRASVLVVLALAGLLVAPVESGGETVDAACQWTIPSGELARIWDPRHVAFFVALTLLACLPQALARPLVIAAALLGYGVAVELSQSVFSRGHCRGWDLAANGIGIAIGGALVVVLRRARGRGPGPPPAPGGD